MQMFSFSRCYVSIHKNLLYKPVVAKSLVEFTTILISILT